jgi:hypothetical protein
MHGVLDWWPGVSRQLRFPSWQDLIEARWFRPGYPFVVRISRVRQALVSLGSRSSLERACSATHTSEVSNKKRSDDVEIRL